MKCDYCEKQALYSMGVIKDTGTVEIWACDKHKYMAAAKQKAVSWEPIKLRDNWTNFTTIKE